MSLRERISLARTSCPLWSDSDRIDASQRNAALCHLLPYAAQQSYHYSITSLASGSNDSEMVNPSA
jgi:hypothetical protein